MKHNFAIHLCSFEMSILFDLIIFLVGFILSKCIQNLCSTKILTVVLFMGEKCCHYMTIIKQLVKYILVFKYPMPIKNHAFDE